MMQKMIMHHLLVMRQMLVQHLLVHHLMMHLMLHLMLHHVIMMGPSMVPRTPSPPSVTGEVEMQITNFQTFQDNKSCKSDKKPSHLFSSFPSYFFAPYFMERFCSGSSPKFPLFENQDFIGAHLDGVRSIHNTLIINFHRHSL